MMRVRTPGPLFFSLAAVCLMTACSDAAGVDTPGPLATLVLAPGLATTGVTGEPLPTAPAVIALDQAGRGIPGLQVTFSVGSGAGTVAGGVATTDSSGRAQAGEWRLGPVPGEQTLVAVAHGAAGEQRQVVLTVHAGWRWSMLQAPMDVPRLSGFQIHPSDPMTWYAMSIEEGLWVSTDAGDTWMWALSEAGLNARGFKVDPHHPDTILTGLRNKLLVSGDRGLTWNVRHTLDSDLWIRSIEILSDGTLLVAPQWPPGRTPGVFRSEDRGLNWTHHPYGTGEGTRILTWVLQEDPATGTVWAGNEIADHPQPYRPPFLASTDGGRTWQDVTARLPFAGSPWHVIDVVLTGDRLFALTEGAGLFRSGDGGATWVNLGRPFAASIMTDPRMPATVFGGDFAAPYGQGDVLVSFDHGTSFRSAGRLGHNVAALALTLDGRGLIVSSWGGGLHRAELPQALSQNSASVP
jgi:hypothetical protein